MIIDCAQNSDHLQWQLTLYFCFVAFLNYICRGSPDTSTTEESVTEGVGGGVTVGTVFTPMHVYWAEAQAAGL